MPTKLFLLCWCVTSAREVDDATMLLQLQFHNKPVTLLEDSTRLVRICRTVEDSYEDWSNTKHAAKDGIMYMGGFDRGQQTVTKSFDLIPGVQYRLSVVLDTWASVDNEPMKIKAAEKELTVQSRAYNVCNNGWTAYPAGTGRFLGVEHSGFSNWQDCWKNVELTFTAPASGKTHVELYAGLDEHIGNEAWGWHDLKLEPLNCPPQASREDEAQEASPAREGDEEEVAQWNLVCRQSNDFWFHKDQWSLNSGDPDNANFAILDQLESFRRDGRFVFKLRWPNNDFEDQVWSQTSNPVTSQGGGVQGYQVISVPYTEQNWGGLEYNNGVALLDGSVNTGNWWYAVGSFQKFSSGIPGPNHIVADAVELWVRASSSDVLSHAGTYDVYYRGEKRSVGAVMGCDGGIEQPGIFKDQLRTEGVREKCSQARDAKAIYYVMNTHGAGKYECLWPEGNNLVGSHYTGPNAFWGTIEYRSTSQSSCPKPGDAPKVSTAGNYDVYYRGGKRSGIIKEPVGAVMSCDGGIEQPGIFKDQLRTEGVREKCSQARDAQATYYVLNTHGAGKYECLWVEGDNVVGSHYTGPNAFWGTIEYRLTSRTSC